MVRFATINDIDWLKALYLENKDMIALQPPTEFFSLAIEKNQFYLLCNDEDETEIYTAMHIEEFDTYFQVSFISTKLEYRGHGYADMLSSYVYNRMNRNSHFIVQRGSSFEQWVFSNPVFAANATKVGELESFYGVKFDKYEVTYPFEY